jgi:hypothetical protein
MSAKDSTAPSLKQRAKDELVDLLWIFLYLAFFFCALSTYATMLLRRYEIDYLNYSLALINALIVAKVILLGEMAHLGTRLEARPLYQSVLYKSFVFTLLVFAFHLVEEFIKRLIHHGPSGAVLHSLRWDELVSRSLVILCAFIPLFSVRELGRVMGHQKLHELFFKTGAATKAAVPGRAAEIKS